MNRINLYDNVWSIVLAGGDGDRLKPFVQQWLGQDKPKQYCTFIGTRSMFQHTLDRADQISTPERKVTVIAAEHRRRGWLEHVKRKSGRFLVQPANPGTAAALFLALTYVRKQDPWATVVILPSDHFIYPEDRFIGAVRSAVQVSRSFQQWLVLLGVPPRRPDPDFGWIQPSSDLGRYNGHRVRLARSFIEKPPLSEGRRAMAEGALLNTFILAASSQLLWSQGKRCFPEMMAQLESFADKIGTATQEEELDEIYKNLPSLDFSSQLLANVPEEIALLELTGVLWSDWGRAERVIETLRELGRKPEFAHTLQPADSVKVARIAAGAAQRRVS